MKRVLLFLAVFCTFSNLQAAVPEDGVYIIVPQTWEIPMSMKDDYPDNVDKRYFLLNYMRWNEQNLEKEPALLVIVDGAITQAHGVIYIDFFYKETWPGVSSQCPWIPFDLGKAKFVKETDNSFTVSLNIEKNNAGIVIQSQRFSAMHGVLNFDSPVAGKYTLTAGISYLTKNLQAGVCTIEYTMYAIKL